MLGIPAATTNKPEINIDTARRICNLRATSS
jgi:hypothetical protein